MLSSRPPLRRCQSHSPKPTTNSVVVGDEFSSPVVVVVLFIRFLCWADARSPSWTVPVPAPAQDGTYNDSCRNQYLDKPFPISGIGILPPGLRRGILKKNVTLPPASGGGAWGCSNKVSINHLLRRGRDEHKTFHDDETTATKAKTKTKTNTDESNAREKGGKSPWERRPVAVAIAIAIVAPNRLVPEQ